MSDPTQATSFGRGIPGPSPAYNPVDDQWNSNLRSSAPRKIIRRKRYFPEQAHARMELTDPREIAVHELLMKTEGFRFDLMAHDIVRMLDAMAVTEAFELPSKVTS